MLKLNSSECDYIYLNNYLENLHQEMTRLFEENAKYCARLKEELTEKMSDKDCWNSAESINVINAKLIEIKELKITCLKKAAELADDINELDNLDKKLLSLKQKISDKINYYREKIEREGKETLTDLINDYEDSLLERKYHIFGIDEKRKQTLMQLIQPSVEQQSIEQALEQSNALYKNAMNSLSDAICIFKIPKLAKCIHNDVLQNLCNIYANRGIEHSATPLILGLIWQEIIRRIKDKNAKLDSGNWIAPNINHIFAKQPQTLMEFKLAYNEAALSRIYQEITDKLSSANNTAPWKLGFTNISRAKIGNYNVPTTIRYIYHELNLYYQVKNNFANNSEACQTLLNKSEILLNKIKAKALPKTKYYQGSLLERIYNLLKTFFGGGRSDEVTDLYTSIANLSQKNTYTCTYT